MVPFMRRRITPRTTWPPRALDELLLAALRCAIAQRLDDVSEALLCALEAQARCTGEHACLDAAYLWAHADQVSAGDPVPSD